MVLKVVFEYRHKRNKGASHPFVQEKSIPGSSKSLKAKEKMIEDELREIDSEEPDLAYPL